MQERIRTGVEKKENECSDLMRPTREIRGKDGTRYGDVMNKTVGTKLVFRLLGLAMIALLAAHSSRWLVCVCVLCVYVLSCLDWTAAWSVQPPRNSPAS